MKSPSIDENANSRQPAGPDLPCFVDKGPGYIDGWKPAPSTGDDDMDRMLGEIYGDLAVKYARETRDPKFITMVMAFIYFKTTRGHLKMGATEEGFLNRVAKLAYVGSLN